MYNTPKQLNKILTPYDWLLILIDCSCVASRGLLLPMACGWLVLNGESNTQSSTTVYVVAKYKPRTTTKAYWLVSENWSFVWRACMKLLDETKRSETRDETPRPFGPRPRRDPRHTGPRPRRWAFCPRRDRDETLVRLETVSRPRRRDRDHIPAYGALTVNSAPSRGRKPHQRKWPNWLCDENSLLSILKMYRCGVLWHRPV